MDGPATRSRRAVCGPKHCPAGGKQDERHRGDVERWQIVPRAKLALYLADLKLVHGDVGGVYSTRIGVDSGTEWRW